MVPTDEYRKDQRKTSEAPNERERGPAVAHPAPHAGEIVGRPTPPYEVVGVDALSPLLLHVDFPASKEEVAQRIGQARIPVSKTQTMRVEEILDEVTPDRFRSSNEVEDAVKRVWDQIAPHPDRGNHQAQRDDLTGREPN